VDIFSTVRVPHLRLLPLALIAPWFLVPAVWAQQGSNVDESGILTAKTFYVDGAAATSGNGTAANPFKTIQEGLNVARTVWRDQQLKTKVVIRNGTYRESAQLDIGVINNFTATQLAASTARNAGAVIVIEGESQAGVVIEGADALTGWTQVGNRWWAPLPANFGPMPSELSGVTAGVSTPNALAYRKEMLFVQGKLLEQKKRTRGGDMGDIFHRCCR